MDKQLRQKLEEKIQEIYSKRNDILNIANSLAKRQDGNNLVFGITVGMMYNSFYYQTRRILNRNPTHHEFDEFMNIITNLEIFGKN